VAAGREQASRPEGGFVKGDEIGFFMPITHFTEFFGECFIKKSAGEIADIGWIK